MKVNLNLDEPLEQIKKLQQEDFVKEALTIGAKLFVQEIRKTAPKKTGKYAKSWEAQKPKKTTVSVETPMGFLHLILEYQGSRPHHIYPVRAQALHWVDEETGKDMFRKHVYHPGFESIPHVRPAVDKILPIWTDRIFKLLKKKYKWLIDG